MLIWGLGRVGNRALLRGDEVGEVGRGRKVRLTVRRDILLSDTLEQGREHPAWGLIKPAKIICSGPAKALEVS